MNGKQRYVAVKAIESKIKNQGKWRKRGNKITQNSACRSKGISTYQYRNWKKIIDSNSGKPAEDVYKLLEDRRYAPNKLSPAEEKIIIDYHNRFPHKTYRGIASDMEKLIGRKLHHNTIKRVINTK